MPPALLLARSTLLEARRSGLPWLLFGLLAAALGLAAFLLTAHVASSVVREGNDKVLELALALPLSRSQYYLGKLAGYGAIGLGFAAALSVPMLLWAAPANVALWGVSLALELLLVSAASLFFAVTLANVVPAIAASAGLYLLARSIAAIQLLARGPLTEQTWTQSVARGAVDAVALLLPRLDAATRSDWLLYAAPAPGEYAVAVGALLLYAILLCAAGLFDFHRRNL